MRSSGDVIQIHLVRHGEVHNPDGVLYGRMPGFHLSKKGKTMAERLGQYFSHFPLSGLVSSPLERAQETMAPISAAHPDLVVDIDNRLIEAENKFAGQRFGAYNQALFKPSNWPLLCNPTVPSWGEPYRQIKRRMTAALYDFADTLKPGDHGVMVSHQLPIWILRLGVENKRLMHNPARRRCSLASVTTFRIKDGRVEGITYAEPALDLLGADGNRAFSRGGSKDEEGIE